MKIIHRISKNLDVSQQEQLRALGIEVGIGLVTFDIDESHPSWNAVAELAVAWNAVDVATTRFTAAELSAAKQLRLVADWRHGFPEPSDNFGYLDECYDLTDYCASCGVGKKQIRPLQLKGEPKWGKYQLLQVNWLNDEFFVPAKIWMDTFQPFGIPHETVVERKSGKPLKTVVQLKIETIASSFLTIHDQTGLSRCQKCGRDKYFPITRGKFPGLESELDAPLVKSQEYFGSGASAWQAVIVSGAFYRAVTKLRLRGFRFTPT